MSQIIAWVLHNREFKSQEALHRYIENIKLHREMDN